MSSETFKQELLAELLTVYIWLCKSFGLERGTARNLFDATWEAVETCNDVTPEMIMLTQPTARRLRAVLLKQGAPVGKA